MKAVQIILIVIEAAGLYFTTTGNSLTPSPPGSRIVPEIPPGKLEELQEVVFLDIERVNGRGQSDPIQIGMVKYSYGLGAVVSKEEINVWTDEEIDEWGSKFCHNIWKVDGKMLKKGQILHHVSQLQAVEKFDKFIEGSGYLIAHGDVDFQTIRALLRKTKDSPSYERVERVDSQKFFKRVMRRDHGEAKHGMKTIVDYYGDPATKAAHEVGAHGALCDAEALCAVSTGPTLYDRFKDWLILEVSAERKL